MSIMNEYLDKGTTRQDLEKLVFSLSNDGIFGVFTRQAFQHLIFPKVKEKITAVIFGDIDNLHDLNNKYGYRAVDKKIQKALFSRGEDIVLRWYSGDEIVWVLLEGEVELAAQRIQKSFQKEHIGVTFTTIKTGNLKNWASFEDVVESLSKEVILMKPKDTREEKRTQTFFRWAKNTLLVSLLLLTALSRNTFRNNKGNRVNGRTVSQSGKT